jgi:hypothetical protein
MFVPNETKAQQMELTASTPPIHYDPSARRLWILGQRCHHGAVGAVLTAAAGAWIGTKGIGRRQLAEARAASRAMAIAGLGGMLMLHDRKDHMFWFERGRGSQM